MAHLSIKASHWSAFRVSGFAVVQLQFQLQVDGQGFIIFFQEHRSVRSNMMGITALSPCCGDQLIDLYTCWICSKCQATICLLGTLVSNSGPTLEAYYPVLSYWLSPDDPLKGQVQALQVEEQLQKFHMEFLLPIFRDNNDNHRSRVLRKMLKEWKAIEL